MSEHHQIQQSKKPESSPQRRSTLIIQTPVSSPAAIIQRARINPKSLTPADVLQLQRTIGNRAVGRLLSGIRSASMAQRATVQRQEISEEGEPIQGMFESKPEEEICPSCVQRQEIPEEEEPLQGKMIETIQRQETPEEEPLQTKRENNTGMPDSLKAGVENLSGIDMSDVRVHYNSSKPAEVGALAYTQGTDIHVAPGQERHLPHEAWHVVQQAQDRVHPTIQMNSGVLINDDVGLETEADGMGEKALKSDIWSTNIRLESNSKNLIGSAKKGVIQNKIFLEYIADLISEPQELDEDSFLELFQDLFSRSGKHAFKTQYKDHLEQKKQRKIVPKPLDKIIAWISDENKRTVKVKKDSELSDFLDYLVNQDELFGDEIVKEPKHSPPTGFDISEKMERGRSSSTRRMSFTLGPDQQFPFASPVSSGINVPNFGTEQSTASVGLFVDTSEKRGRLVSGGSSGLKRGKYKSEKHAEEAVMDAFEEVLLSKTLRTAPTGEVLFLLHISKSPCKDRCIPKIRHLLNTYEHLRIKLLIGQAYRGNPPSSEHIDAFKDLIQGYNKDGKIRIYWQPMGSFTTIATELELSSKQLSSRFDPLRGETLEEAYGSPETWRRKQEEGPHHEDTTLIGLLGNPVEDDDFIKSLLQKDVKVSEAEPMDTTP